MTFGNSCSTRRPIGTPVGIGVSVCMSVESYHSNRRLVGTLVVIELPFGMSTVSSCSSGRPTGTQDGMGETVGISVGSSGSTKRPIDRLVCMGVRVGMSVRSYDYLYGITS